MPYIPHTEAELGEMLKVIGANSLDDLFADIAPDMRPKSFDLPAAEARTIPAPTLRLSPPKTGRP